LVGVLALFFTAMVAITYLTRVYLKGEALAATATTS
jgi:hypothetical protein